MPEQSTVPARLGRALAAALVVLVVPAAGAAVGAPAGAAGRACAEVSTDVADLPRSVPLPQGDYTVRGYLRVDCKHLLDLALEVEDLGPEHSHLLERLRAKGFRAITSTRRSVEVVTGPDAEPEVRDVFKVHARGHGLRVKVEMGFVGAAPRWSGTALIRYVVRPLR